MMAPGLVATSIGSHLRQIDDDQGAGAGFGLYGRDPGRGGDVRARSRDQRGRYPMLVGTAVT